MSGNPKDRVGSAKIPLHLFPATAIAMGSLGLLNGALKYGRNNFRAEPVRASIYVDAALRHLSAWFNGEESDPDDGVPHLAAILANVAILVDAQSAGTLIDDRNFGDPTAYRDTINRLTPLVAQLQCQHAGRDPVHYSKTSPESTSSVTPPLVMGESKTGDIPLTEDTPHAS